MPGPEGGVKRLLLRLAILARGESEAGMSMTKYLLQGEERVDGQDAERESRLVRRGSQEVEEGRSVLYARLRVG